jgi:hypothetical protein
MKLDNLQLYLIWLSSSHSGLLVQFLSVLFIFYFVLVLKFYALRRFSVSLQFHCF